jgi:hypothetical protein
MDNKRYNTVRERIARQGTPTEVRKKMKQIAIELGQRNITLKDIASTDFGGKSRGFIDMMDKTGMTMDDVVMLQAYSKAIIDRDIKAAEFIRDTKGEKPSTTVDMTVGDKSPIEQMSDEELKAYSELLKANIELSKREND